MILFISYSFCLLHARMIIFMYTLIVVPIPWDFSSINAQLLLHSQIVITAQRYKNLLGSFFWAKTRAIFIFFVVRNVAILKQTFKLVSDFTMSFFDSNLIVQSIYTSVRPVHCRVSEVKHKKQCWFPLKYGCLFGLVRLKHTKCTNSVLSATWF